MLRKAVAKDKGIDEKQLEEKDIIEFKNKVNKDPWHMHIRTSFTKDDIKFYKNGSSITIHGYVSDIATDAFDKCEDITDVTIEGSPWLSSNSGNWIKALDSIKSLRTIYVFKELDDSVWCQYLNNRYISVEFKFS